MAKAKARNLAVAGGYPRRSEAAYDDVTVIWDGGTVALVRPVSKAAKAWVEENVPTEGWQWLGGGFAVEPRYLENLVDGLNEAGLRVGQGGGQ